MARVSTYLNFPDKTEEAFIFYKSASATESADAMGCLLGCMPRSLWHSLDVHR